MVTKWLERIVTDVSSRNVLSSLTLSFALTIFYKRTFRADMVPLVALFILLHVSVETFDSAPSYFSVPVALCFTAFVLEMEKHISTLISLRPGVLFTNFIVLLDLFREGRIPKIPLYLKIIVASIPQFARYPSFIKAMLQPVRAVLGPLYMIHCVSYALQNDSNTYERGVWFGTAWRSCNLVARLKVAAAALSTFAGVLFRPDNRVVATFLLKGVEFQHLRFLHRYTMTCSFILFLCSLFLEKVN